MSFYFLGSVAFKWTPHFSVDCGAICHLENVNCFIPNPLLTVTLTTWWWNENSIYSVENYIERFWCNEEMN